MQKEETLSERITRVFLENFSKEKARLLGAKKLSPNNADSPDPGGQGSTGKGSNQFTFHITVRKGKIL